MFWKSKPKLATVVYVIKDDEVLLAKKTKKIGVGRFNGYGGKKKWWESLRRCARRELREESGLYGKLSEFKKVAILYFKNTDEDGKITFWTVHIYTIDYRHVTGVLKPSKTMVEPTFFPKFDLPSKLMMPADKEWTPRVMRGKKVLVWGHYGPRQEKLLEPLKIEEVKFFKE